MTDFKIGDIVRIKGGVDEWRVRTLDPHGDIACYIELLTNNTVSTDILYKNLELVRRPGEEKPTMGEQWQECHHEWDRTILLTSNPAQYKCKKCPMTISVNTITEPPPKKKVERWLWVFSAKSPLTSRDFFTHDDWLTRGEAQEKVDRYGWKLIGHDPNCKEPLVTEE